MALGRVRSSGLPVECPATERPPDPDRGRGGEPPGEARLRATAACERAREARKAEVCGVTGKANGEAAYTAMASACAPGWCRPVIAHAAHRPTCKVLIAEAEEDRKRYDTELADLATARRPPALTRRLSPSSKICSTTCNWRRPMPRALRRLVYHHQRLLLTSTARPLNQYSVSYFPLYAAPITYAKLRVASASVHLRRSMFTEVTSARGTRCGGGSYGSNAAVGPGRCGRWGLRRETAEEEEARGGGGRSERGLAGGSLGSGLGCTAARRHGQARTGAPVLALPMWPAGC